MLTSSLSRLPHSLSNQKWTYFRHSLENSRSTTPAQRAAQSVLKPSQKLNTTPHPRHLLPSLPLNKIVFPSQKPLHRDEQAPPTCFSTCLHPSTHLYMRTSPPSKRVTSPVSLPKRPLVKSMTASPRVDYCPSGFIPHPPSAPTVRARIPSRPPLAVADLASQ